MVFENGVDTDSWRRWCILETLTPTIVTRQSFQKVFCTKQLLISFCQWWVYLSLYPIQCHSFWLHFPTRTSNSCVKACLSLLSPRKFDKKIISQNKGQREKVVGDNLWLQRNWRTVSIELIPSDTRAEALLFIGKNVHSQDRQEKRWAHNAHSTKYSSLLNQFTYQKVIKRTFKHMFFIVFIIWNYLW